MLYALAVRYPQSVQPKVDPVGAGTQITKQPVNILYVYVRYPPMWFAAICRVEPIPLTPTGELQTRC